MWNETRGTSSIVDRAIVGQAGVWQESPLVGVDGLLKKHQATSSKAFRMTERPFLELVNVRGDTRDAAFVRAVESRDRLPAAREAEHDGAGQRLRHVVARP